MGKESVNHPSHYNRENAMECIEEMELIFGKEAVKHFCLCNAWKYRYRAADKNGEEDLKKSDWYLNKYKELCKEEIIRDPESTITTTYPTMNAPMVWTYPADNTGWDRFPVDNTKWDRYVPPVKITCADKIN